MFIYHDGYDKQKNDGCYLGLDFARIILRCWWWHKANSCKLEGVWRNHRWFLLWIWENAENKRLVWKRNCFWYCNFSWILKTRCWNKIDTKTRGSYQGIRIQVLYLSLYFYWVISTWIKTQLLTSLLNGLQRHWSIWKWTICFSIWRGLLKDEHWTLNGPLF